MRGNIKMKLFRFITLAVGLMIFYSSFISSASIISTMIQQQKEHIISYEASNNDLKIQQILDTIDDKLVQGYLVDLVNIGQRYTGTYGCKKAAEYIYNQFTQMELEVRYHYWEDWGPLWQSRLFSDKIFWKPHLFKSNNVEATLPGINSDTKDEILIFNAHYDTVRGTVGANDDGSGTAGVLAAAYALSQYEFNRTIRFVTFSGEEIHLLGSKAYVKEQYEMDANILFEFNADMIGKASDDYNATRMGIGATEDAHWVLDIFQDLTDKYDMNFQFRRYSVNRNLGRGWSDYFHFITFGYESICVWESEGDPNMHTPQDTLDNVNFSYLANTTRHIAGTLAILGDMEDIHPQIRIANPKKGRLFYEDFEIKKLRLNKTIVLDDTLICTEITKGKTPIEKVEFFYDGELMSTIEEPPYQWRLNERSFAIRKKIVKVIAYDQLGRTTEDELLFRYINLIKKR
jgi:hypothetical protein